MDEISKLVTSPVWWFSTIFVGFILSIASDYAKPHIDKVVSKFSSACRTRTENEKRLLVIDMSYLVSSPEALAEASENEVRLRLQAIFTFLLSISQLLFLIMVVVVGVTTFWIDRALLWSSMVLSLFTGIWSLSRHASASRTSYVVQVARQRLIREAKDVSMKTKIVKPDKRI